VTNFDYQADSLQMRVSELNADIAGFEERLAVARVRTAKLLAIAKEIGVTAVSVGKKHARVGNESFPFGAGGSIFTPPDERIDGRPAAWHLAEIMGISHGAGNTGQHQADIEELIEGVYEIRKGKWYRIDLEDK